MKSKGLRLLIFWTLLMAILGGAGSSLWAQSATTGALTGTVTDSTGAAIPGATVTLTNTATGQTQTTRTEANGLYGFSLLSPGTCDMTFSAEGFKTSQAVSLIVNVSEAGPECQAGGRGVDREGDVPVPAQ